MNFQPLNRPIGIKAILISAGVLLVLFPLFWRLGTVDVSSGFPVFVFMFALAMTFLVLLSLLGASKTPNPGKAFRHYLIIIGCAIVAGVVIYFLGV